jgi:hypothetical protein
VLKLPLYKANLLRNVQMFTNNLLKRPKLDAKRKKAIAYFNNKFPNAPVVENSGFWTFNRVKIFISAAVALLAAWVVQFKFPESGKAFLCLLGYTYVLAPFICFKLNKYPASAEIEKMKFIKVVSRVYRQSELPSGIGVASIFLTVLICLISKLIFDNMRPSDLRDFFGISIFLSPFLMYNLLCFIGNHPLAIFTFIGYLPARNGIGYNIYHSSQNSESTFNHNNFAIPGSISSYNNSCAPNSIQGQTGWDLHYSGNDYGINSHDSSNTYHNS